MNTTKHTPGPWTYDETWALILAEHGAEIAAVHAARSVKGEPQANARLIAAAPTMYEALQAIIHELNTYGCINSQDNDPDGHESPAIAKVYAAIKSAAI